MSVEVLPLGIRCQLKCTYCYQDPMREAGNFGPASYDMAAMKASLLAEGGDAFTVFGGEPLLVPLVDLEELWAFGLTLPKKRNGIQTNGALITDAHMVAFARYNVQVGFSLDGPGVLNRTRWAGTIEETDAATARSQGALEQLLDEGRNPSLIVTLTSRNAASDLPDLIGWIRALAERGLTWCNLHPLEVDDASVQSLALGPEQLATAMLEIGVMMREHPKLTVQPIATMTKLLLGDDKDADCVWHGCDAYTTPAVRGVLGDGSRVNCGRTNSDGVNWGKADTPAQVRPLGLYRTPFEAGGCGGCRFFFACKGHCPGTAEENDWRRKTVHCGSLMQIFGSLERQLAEMGLHPVSLDADRRQALEQRLVESWMGGSTARLRVVTDGGEHGDVPHGDHGDVATPVHTHGDHTDLSRVVTNG